MMNGKNLKKYIVTSCCIVLILLITRYVSGHYYQFLLIQGNSMEPAYHNMQIVLLDKRTNDYQYGDVIAFACEELSAILVKRIAACPGDTVVILNGTLYVNGEVSSIYPEAGYFKEAGILEECVRLGSGEYIVIGDNADDSKDSRYEEVGVVNQGQIVGKVGETRND